MKKLTFQRMFVLGIFLSLISGGAIASWQESDNLKGSTYRLKPDKGPSQTMEDNGYDLGWLGGVLEDNNLTIETARRLPVGHPIFIREEYRNRPSVEATARSRQLMALDRRSRRGSRTLITNGQLEKLKQLESLESQIAAHQTRITDLEKENSSLKNQVGAIQKQLDAERKKAADLAAQLQKLSPTTISTQLNKYLIALWIMLGLAVGAVGMWFYHFRQEASYIKLEKEKKVRYRDKNLVWSKPIRIKDPADPSGKKFIDQWACPLCLPARVSYHTERNFRPHVDKEHLEERKLELNTAS